MKYYLSPLFLFFHICLPVHAQDIDLECEALAKQMIQRLSAEGLLTAESDDRQRAHEIGVELCSGAEASAQEQHEVGKQEALEHWLWQDKPDKPGNKRLKNLKR